MMCNNDECGLDILFWQNNQGLEEADNKHTLIIRDVEKRFVYGVCGLRSIIV